MPKKAIDYIFEASWEVCNKIGGIYTVLSTKAKSLQSLYKDHVIFIGPDVWTAENSAPDFTESKTLLRRWRETALLPEGVNVRVGRWNVPGKPLAILVKFDALYASKDAFYGHMWERFGVDSLHAYGDYDEGCAFARAAGMVIESLVQFLTPKCGGNFVAHFDEWTTGMGLLYVKDHCPQVATVFTTHATSIGRSICGNGKPLYDYLTAYNGDQMARELNMEAKHSLEKTAAHEADCFTTVSDVTARECECLLERRPDVVTPNGFEPGIVPVKTKFKRARVAARLRLLEVASALTGRRYDDDTFIVCTSGRCEYRNKGLDMYCDVMMRLADSGTPRKVVSFVMVPAWSAGPRVDLVSAVTEGFSSGLADKVLTHNLNNYNEDPVNRRIHDLGFADSNAADNVAVIYVPCYLKGDDGIFNMSYYDLLIGMDATVFPSYYEPWGYTPLESIAFGVPTVTTSLSGFGQWIKATTEHTFADCGVSVVERNDSNYCDVVTHIADDLTGLMALKRAAKSQVDAAAMATADRADWSRFITFYEEAYEKALNNCESRN